MTCKLCEFRKTAEEKNAAWKFRLDQMQMEIDLGETAAAERAELLARGAFCDMVTAVRDHAQMVKAGVEHEDTGRGGFMDMIMGGVAGDSKKIDVH